MAKREGFEVTGFPTRPGNGLIKASTKFKVPKVPKPKVVPAEKPKKIVKPKEPTVLY
jgi:hypothetical protein